MGQLILGTAQVPSEEETRDGDVARLIIGIILAQSFSTSVDKS